MGSGDEIKVQEADDGGPEQVSPPSRKRGGKHRVRNTGVPDCRRDRVRRDEPGNPGPDPVRNGEERLVTENSTAGNEGIET